MMKHSFLPPSRSLYCPPGHFHWSEKRRLRPIRLAFSPRPTHALARPPPTRVASPCSRGLSWTWLHPQPLACAPRGRLRWFSRGPSCAPRVSRSPSPSPHLPSPSSPTRALSSPSVLSPSSPLRDSMRHPRAAFCCRCERR